MKRVVAAVLAVVLTMSTSFSVGRFFSMVGEPVAGDVAPVSKEGTALISDEYATLGDVFEDSTEYYTYSYDSQRFAFAFRDGGTAVCVTAPMDEGTYEALGPIGGEEFDSATVFDMVSSLPVDGAAYYETTPLTQDELDAWAGATSADLRDAGFEFYSQREGETDGCWIKYGVELYYVTFDQASDSYGSLFYDDSSAVVTNIRHSGLALWNMVPSTTA